MQLLDYRPGSAFLLSRLVNSNPLHGQMPTNTSAWQKIGPVTKPEPKPEAAGHKASASQCCTPLIRPAPSDNTTAAAAAEIGVDAGDVEA